MGDHQAVQVFKRQPDLFPTHNRRLSGQSSHVEALFYHKRQASVNVFFIRHHPYGSRSDRSRHTTTPRTPIQR